MAGDLKKILKKRLLVSGTLCNAIYMLVMKCLSLAPHSALTTARSLSQQALRRCDDSEA